MKLSPTELTQNRGLLSITKNMKMSKIENLIVIISVNRILQLIITDLINSTNFRSIIIQAIKCKLDNSTVKLGYNE